MTDQNQAMSFDDIDMSGIVAAPTYDTPPSGTYLCRVKMVQKLVNDKRAITPEMTLQEVVEIGTDHTEKPAEVGQKFGGLYFCDTPEKAAYVKRDLGAFFDAAGTQSLNTMVASIQDVLCKVVVTYDRNDYSRFAFEIVG